MNKKLAFTLIFTVFLTYLSAAHGYAVKSKALDANSSSSAAGSAESAPVITSESAIVADADSGYIYYGKDIHKKMYPASITKILTALVAVENGNDSDVIKISEDLSAGMPSDAARIGLMDGEQITQEEALYTMFLASANDSANALAVHIGGTINNFVTMMNNRARELGAVDSNFSNANGLPDKNNITSAYDMAIITKKALSEPKLMKYFGSKTYSMPATNKRPATTYFTLHKMMKNTVYKYNGVFAGKTGWETMSGHTLVTAARKNGRTLICVAMKSSSGYSIYKDTTALLNYVFNLPEGSGTSEYLVSPVKQISGSTHKTVHNQATVPVKNIENKSKTRSMTAPVVLLICSVSLFALLLIFSRRPQRTRRRKNTSFLE